MNKDSKIFIAGRGGQVGSAIERKFRTEGYENIIGLSSKDLDLREQVLTRGYFEKERPEYVILAAAKVGGIMANIQAPAEFLYDNLAIQSNIIECSRIYNVKKLLFLASSCIYPRLAPQPMKEESCRLSALRESLSCRLSGSMLQTLRTILSSQQRNQLRC